MVKFCGFVQRVVVCLNGNARNLSGPNVSQLTCAFTASRQRRIDSEAAEGAHEYLTEDSNRSRQHVEDCSNGGAMTPDSMSQWLDSLE